MVLFQGICKAKHYESRQLWEKHRKGYHITEDLNTVFRGTHSETGMTKWHACLIWGKHKSSCRISGSPTESITRKKNFWGKFYVIATRLPHSDRKIVSGTVNLNYRTNGICPALPWWCGLKKINKTRRQPIKQTTEEKSIKKKKKTRRKIIRISDPEKIKQLATTDYLTNPCNFKGMKIRSSVLMLYKWLNLTPIYPVAKYIIPQL